MTLPRGDTQTSKSAAPFVRLLLNFPGDVTKDSQKDRQLEGSTFLLSLLPSVFDRLVGGENPLVYSVLEDVAAPPKQRWRCKGANKDPIYSPVFHKYTTLHYNEHQSMSFGTSNGNNGAMSLRRKRPLHSASSRHHRGVHLLSLLCLVTSVHGFTLLANKSRLSTALAARRAATAPAAVQELTPIKESPAERRRSAMKALDRQQVQKAMLGVDAQMLEMLSEHLIHNFEGQGQAATTTVEQTNKRPKGRPEFVPGAMNYNTMVKFRERRDLLDYVKSRGVAMSEAEYAAVAPYLKQGSVKIKSARAPSRIKGVVASPDSSPTSATSSSTTISNNAAVTTQEPSALPTTTSKTTALKKRKRVVKNLPQRRKQTEAPTMAPHQDTSTSNRRTNGLDLQKYYRTELLTADEEYSLGMKVQFMMKCEQVHEGLALRDQRLPTMEEWAAACGFTDEDPSFLATEADELLRPAGSETMFEYTDPTTFVGNGQAGNAGPGRGRGRARKPPPTQLKPFLDDSKYRAQLRAKKIDVIPKRKLTPINHGTPTQFVEMLMTAREAKQRMVQSNMRLVVSIARKYSNAGVSLQDLVQEGSLGLSRAAEKFQPTKGFKFSTYASWWIQQAVFRSIAYHSRTIRLPVHIHNLLNRIHKVKNSLQIEFGRAPTNEEIAEHLGMTLQKYNKMLRLTKRSISLEQPKYTNNPKDMFHEGDDLLGDTISSTSALADEATPEKRVDRSLFYADLMDMLNMLEEDEKRVICARYGLMDGLTRTVTAVSNEMRVSKAWVRSQECRALRKLRRPWYEKKLKEHQDAMTSE